MITKEQLEKDREQANLAFLRLKQKYKPQEDKVYLVVEGKDDVAYYTCIFARYPQFSEVEIIVANNRKNVIKTYEAVDWNVISSKRVLYFIDRDLSDITGEYTPTAPNVYITDFYSIENSLFNERLLWASLKAIYGINDLEEAESATISSLYQTAVSAHEQAFFVIMAWIVYWRTHSIVCTLNNINSEDLFAIDQGRFTIKDEYKEDKALGEVIHSICGVPYIEQDLSIEIEKIKKCGGIHKCIRGKFVRAFFVKFLNSITSTLPQIFPGKSKPRASVPIGQRNALQILCGYMATPESLDRFLTSIRN